MSTWFERRRDRARRRRHFEEVAAWVILPLIVVIGWVVGQQVYSELEEPISAFLQNIDRER
ncbi:hypothetical protein FHS82_001628 [Pseudochelatococcus lubricantis]|uniref:Uncharacterized protein n=1 Tax=Pseudochelatococcus lubricantis TaxID=1538102 RepID=A0ABX0UYI5_9HYPH|nr:hypothetical protein [Pseudochelatococcus lubricantis]NIJ57792.1 hypothetical protein [Pseudochelatococcus lubricantis]